jgi:hypothetical protein
MEKSYFKSKQLLLKNMIIINDNTIQGHAVININGGYKLDKSKEEEALKLLINMFYKAIKISKKYNNNKFIINVFLQDFQLDKVRKEFIISTSNILINLFSDNLKQCNILNSNNHFNSILKIINSFLHPQIINKFYIDNV